MSGAYTAGMVLCRNCRRTFLSPLASRFKQADALPRDVCSRRCALQLEWAERLRRG